MKREFEGEAKEIAAMADREEARVGRNYFKRADFKRVALLLVLSPAASVAAEAQLSNCTRDETFNTLLREWENFGPAKQAE